MQPLGTRRSLADEAAHAIREEILAGRFQTGQHLVEADLARRLQTSRGPIREAFRQLVAEGLVREEPRRGTFVVVLDEQDVREIYDLRAAIEGQAARTIASAGSSTAVAQLRSIIERMDAAVHDRDLRAVGRSDLDFHEAICRLSGNTRLHSVFTRHVPALRTLLRIDEHIYSSAQIVEQHRPILEAIERGEASLAQALCEAHCRQARDEVVAFVGALGEGHGPTEESEP